MLISVHLTKNLNLQILLSHVPVDAESIFHTLPIILIHLPFWCLCDMERRTYQNISDHRLSTFTQIIMLDNVAMPV